MITAKPLKAFSVNGRSILTCRVADQNPHVLIGKKLWFYSSVTAAKRIFIEGLSTASDIRKNEYDLHYTGDEVLPSDISDEALIADGPLEAAVREQASQVR